MKIFKKGDKVKINESKNNIRYGIIIQCYDNKLSVQKYIGKKCI